MINKNEPAKLHENAICHKKADWQEQIRGEAAIKRGKTFGLFLNGQFIKTKTLK